MGKPITCLLTTLLLLVSSLCHGQNRMVVSHPVVEIEDQEVHIFYDIVNSSPINTYNVSVLLTNTWGERLNVRSLSGDVGVNISGGVHKHIVWDLEADHVFLEGAIDVQIILEAVPAAFPGIPTHKEDFSDLGGTDPLAGEDGISKNELMGAAGVPVKPKIYSRTGLVFRSLLFPGWGLTHVKKKPHWIKGLAGYGCFAGSVYLNRQAVKTYEQIDHFQDYQDKDDLYQKALKQDNFSEVLAYTAIGIWVVDFIWTLAGTSQLNAKHKQSLVSGLSLITDLDPLTYAPMVGLHISF